MSCYRNSNKKVPCNCAFPHDTHAEQEGERRKKAHKNMEINRFTKFFVLQIFNHDNDHDDNNFGNKKKWDSKLVPWSINA